MGKGNHYCEQCKKGSHGESHFMSGALIGALVGTALGVLFAPDTGEKTRKKLKVVGDDLSVKGKVTLDKVEGIAEEVRVAAAPLIEEIERNYLKDVLTRKKGKINESARDAGISSPLSPSSRNGR